MCILGLHEEHLELILVVIRRYSNENQVGDNLHSLLLSLCKMGNERLQTVMQHVLVCLNYSVLFPDCPDPISSDGHLEAEESDEALALRLQRELDREAAQAETINLEDGGLFFCHLCQRDLTHMTPEGRTQHVNRWAHLLGLFCENLTNSCF